MPTAKHAPTGHEAVGSPEQANGEKLVVGQLSCRHLLSNLRQRPLRLGMQRSRIRAGLQITNKRRHVAARLLQGSCRHFTQLLTMAAAVVIAC